MFLQEENVEEILENIQEFWACWSGYENGLQSDWIERVEREMVKASKLWLDMD